MKGDPRVLEILQSAVSAESLSHAQYIADAEWLDYLGLPTLAAKMREESAEEQGHLTRYCRRLTFLETAPVINPDPTVGHSSITDLLRNQLRLESGAVEMYQRGVDVSRESGDSVSRQIFELTLADEEDHVRFLEGQLGIIAMLGEGQYVQAYVQIAEG